MQGSPYCGGLNGVLIRPFQPADLPALLAGAAEMGWLSLTPAERMVTSPLAVARHSEAVFRQALGQQGALVLIAEIAGTTIGFEFIVIRPQEISGVSEALKLGGWVDSRFRRCGVNRALHQVGEEWCRRQGVRRMVAVVSESNEPSLRALDRLGFTSEKVILAKWLQDLPESVPK